MLLFERGHTDSREKAKAVIMSGNVYVDGLKSYKPGAMVSTESSVEVRGGRGYVSRGGLKLEKALACFEVHSEGTVCIDCGASTGGFTDCLLKHGAQLVYAVDVGYGQLAWSIRSDPRVVTMERTNIRYMQPGILRPQPELAVVDLSFISLALVLPVIRNLLTETCDAVCLIKPQFEAGRDKVGKKGVVRDAETHIEVLDAFIANAQHSGFYVRGLTYSPVKGPEGNIEYLGWLSSTPGSAPDSAKSSVPGSAQGGARSSTPGGAPDSAESSAPGSTENRIYSSAAEVVMESHRVLNVEGK